MQDRGEVVGHAVRLLVSCCLSGHDLFMHLYNYKYLKEWVEGLLLRADSATIRRAMCASMTRLCASHSSRGTDDHEEHITQHEGTPASKHFLQLLFSFLENVEDYVGTAMEYFWVMVRLLKDDSTQYNEDEANSLFNQLVSQIVQHPVVERGTGGTGGTGGVEVDHVVVGLLDVIRTLVKKYPSWLKGKATRSHTALIQEVFFNCVFGIATAENHGAQAPPKCKSTDSRNAAFELLAELARDNEQCFRELYELLKVQVGSLRSGIAGRRWRPSMARRGVGGVRRHRASHGYVGLQNQGATCYMNSLIQQLYLVPEFREGILLVNDKSEDPDDSLLYQMQVLFGNLQQSVQKYFDTTSFCRAVKDYDGEPINPGIQMDANEFFNNLFDKLEDYLKGSVEDHLLSRVFGGKLCNQLIPTGCQHRSERDEPFYTVSLTIKDKKNIMDSLKLFITGEMLQGDNQFLCEYCGEKRDTLRRCVIAELPPVLMLHLKRFEFNFDAMRNVKVNEYCEFPMTLDMEPFTKEYVTRQEEKDEDDIRGSLRMSEPSSLSKSNTADHTDDHGHQTGEGEEGGESGSHPMGTTTGKRTDTYYQYSLVGIVVHQGTADCGHYYSFIKERVPTSSDNKCKWFEFNDTNVTPFDIQRIPEETFGGTEERQYYDREKGEHRTHIRVKTNNAYILVYQRCASHSSISSTLSRDQKAEEDTTHVQREEEGGEVDSISELDDEKEEEEEDNDEEEEGSSKKVSTGEEEENKENEEKDGEEEEKSISREEDDKEEEKENEKRDVEKKKDLERVNNLDSNGDRPGSGPLARSPCFISVLFLARLANAKRRKEQLARQKRREAQITAYMSGRGGHIIPVEIMEGVWEDNKAFLLANHLRGDDFLHFMWDYLNIYTTPIPPLDTLSIDITSKKPKKKKGKKKGGKKKRGMELIQDVNMVTVMFAFKFVFEVAYQVADTDTFDVWIYHVKRLFTHNTKACVWYMKMLVEDPVLMARTLLITPVDRLRRAFTTLTAHVFSCLSPIEASSYNVEITRIHKCIEAKEMSDDDNDDEKEDDSEVHRDILRKSVDGCKSYNILIMECLFSMLPMVRRYMRHCRQYFQLIKDFAMIGDEEKNYLLSRGTIHEFIYFFMEKGKFSRGRLGRRTGISSTSRYSKYARYRGGGGGGGGGTLMTNTHVNAPNFSPMVELISHLVRICKTDSKEVPPTLLPGPTPLLSLSSRDRSALFDPKYTFIVRALRERIHQDAMVAMMTHWTWENRAKTKGFISIIYDGIQNSSHDRFKIYFAVVQGLLDIEDKDQVSRVEMIMPKLIKLVGDMDDRRHITANGNVVNDAAATLVQFIATTLPQSNDRVKKYISKHSSTIKRLENSLEYSSRRTKKDRS